MKRSIANLPKILFATTALTSAVMFGGTALANPVGEQVVEGAATVTRPSATKTEIHQTSNKAIIEWNSFDISKGEWTQFIQPSSSAVILNRITGGDPTKILGQLTANGTVMLVNPDGILFGRDSKIDVGGLVATTHDIDNQDFMEGRYQFNKPGNPSASIINEGLISIREGGVAAFVAPGVRNSGVIAARLSKVSLSSGNSFTLDLYGDELIKLKVDDEIVDQVIDLATGQPMSALVDNQGRITADGGSVALTAVTARHVVDNVINNDGVIEARSVGIHNGKIVLGAQSAETKVPHTPVQKVRVSGKLDASGQSSGQTGGEIHILGEVLGLTRATINADGDAGGGIILVGGDYMGGNPDPEIVSRYGIDLEDQAIRTATNLTVDQDSILSASALTNGNGGKIVNWSDDTTTFRGSVRSKGGDLGGDGGFVEVSGKSSVQYAGMTTDLSAAHGDNGTILFDPASETVDNAKALTISEVLSRGENVTISSTGRVYVDGVIVAYNDSSDADLSILAGVYPTYGNHVGIEIPEDAGIVFTKNAVISAEGSKKLNIKLDALFGWYNLFTDAVGWGDSGSVYATSIGSEVTFEQHMQDIEAAPLSGRDCNVNCPDVFRRGEVIFEAGAEVFTNGGVVEVLGNKGRVAVSKHPIFPISDDQLTQYFYGNEPVSHWHWIYGEIENYFTNKYSENHVDGAFNAAGSRDVDDKGNQGNFVTDISLQYARSYLDLPSDVMRNKPFLTTDTKEALVSEFFPDGVSDVRPYNVVFVPFDSTTAAIRKRLNDQEASQDEPISGMDDKRQLDNSIDKDGSSGEDKQSVADYLFKRDNLEKSHRAVPYNEEYSHVIVRGDNGNVINFPQKKNVELRNYLFFKVASKTRSVIEAFKKVRAICGPYCAGVSKAVDAVDLTLISADWLDKHITKTPRTPEELALVLARKGGLKSGDIVEFSDYSGVHRFKYNINYNKYVELGPNKPIFGGEIRDYVE